MWYMSGVTNQLSHVPPQKYKTKETKQNQTQKNYIEKIEKKKENLVELVGRGSVINGATPSSFNAA